MVIYPYAYMTYIMSSPAGLGGGIPWRPPPPLQLVIRRFSNYCFILNEIQQEHERWMVTETVVFVDTVFSFTDISVLRYAYSLTALLLQCIAATVNFINLFILAV